MTNKEIEELGKRAVASPHFRWMPGMLGFHRWTGPIRVVTCDGVTEDPCLVIEGGPLSALVEDYGIMRSWPACDGSVHPVLPDLTDPATLGCMPHLVREAYGAGTCVDIDEDYHRVIVTVFSGHLAGYAESVRTFEVECTRETRHEALGAALVAALEAAP